MPSTPELPAPAAAPELSIPTAAVLSCALLFFDAELAAQRKEDVALAVLLSQLATDRNFNRVQDSQNWYNSFFNVLSKMGWATTSYKTTPVEDAYSKGSVDTVISSILQEELAGPILSNFKDRLSALRFNEKAVALFDQNTHKDSKADFQVGFCSESDGNPMLRFFHFHFESSNPIEHVLWTQFSSDDVTFLFGRDNMLLNTELFDQIRDTVRGRVGEKLESSFVPFH